MLRGPYLRTVAGDWVDDVGYLGLTRRKYLYTMWAFDRRLQARRPGLRFCEVTPEEVRDFVYVREDGGPRADRSRKATMNICWSMWDWATSTEQALATSNPVTRLRALHRREHRAPRNVRRKTWLREDRAKLLVATTRGDGTDPARVRDAFVLAVFLYTGLRLAELHRLRWRDVDFGAGEHGVLHVLGKGGKVAQQPLNPAARRLLFEWRSAFIVGYGSDDVADHSIVPRLASGVLGPVGGAGPQVRVRRIQWGRPIACRTSLYRIVQERAAEAGLGHVAPHDLRRSFAGILQDRDVDMEDIRRAMRHESVETTRIYLEDKPDLAAGFADFDLG